MFCVHFSEGATVPQAHTKIAEAQNLLNQAKLYWPQLDMDGMKNVWIVKPGAKSRGRGNLCV